MSRSTPTADIDFQWWKLKPLEAGDNKYTSLCTINNECMTHSRGRCMYCDCANIDMIDGLLTCRNCFSVLDRIIDYGAEWRFYGSTENGGSGSACTRNTTRCSPPTNILVPTLGSMISSRPCQPSTTIQRYHFWNSMNYKERSLCSVFEQLSVIAVRNGIPQVILEEAKRLYKTSSSLINTRGDNRKGLIACCMYMACKLNGAPRNAREMAELFGVDNGVISRGCKILQSVVVEEVGTIETSQPIDYVRRFSSRLHMDDVECKFASYIVEKALALEIVSDFMPSSVAAGALHMTNIELNVGIQRQQIARACFLSDSTVSKCYKRLQQYKGHLLSHVKQPEKQEDTDDA